MTSAPLTRLVSELGSALRSADQPAIVAHRAAIALQRAPFAERAAHARAVAEIGAERRRVSSSRAVAAQGRHGTPWPLACRLADAAGDGAVVFDPACGTGTLLVAYALRCHAKGRAEPDLHGVDIDAEAVSLARAALAMLLGRAPDDPVIEYRVRVGNGLGGGLAPPTIDVVLANPPWVSHSGRHAVSVPDDEAARLRSEFESYGGWPSLHGPFVERAFRLVRPGGRVAVLVPASVAEHHGFGALRAAVTRAAGQAPQVEPLAAGVFPEVSQAAVLLHATRALTPGPPSAARWTAPPTAGVLGDAQKRLAALPRPDASVFCDIGVHTGNASRLLVTEHAGPNRVPLLEGRQIHAGQLDAPARYLDLEAARGEKGDRYWRVGAAESYTSIPIVLRQTARRPIAARHEPAGYFRNSVLGCRGLPGVPHARTIAWLNATAIAWWHASAVAESRQRAFPQLKIRHLRDLPLPAEGPAALPPAGAGDAAVSAALGLRADEHEAMVAALPGLLNPREEPS